MQAIAPRFVLLGGCFLAFGASFTNVGFLIEAGTSVSHLTGDISRFGVDLAGEGWSFTQNLFLLGAATAGFVGGAVFSGLLLHHPQLEFAKPYGRIISGIGILFLGAYLFLNYSLASSIFLGAFACGIQNALATKYRGSILRTTHVTGLMTDFGVLLGMRLRGHKVENWRIGVPFYLTVAFFSGAVAGGFVVLWLELPWLLLAGLSYLAGGVIWSVLKRTVFLGSVRV